MNKINFALLLLDIPDTNVTGKHGKYSRSRLDSHHTDDESSANQWLAVILVYAGLVAALFSFLMYFSNIQLR